MRDRGERAEVLTVQQQAVAEPPALEGALNDGDSGRAVEGGRPGQGSGGNQGSRERGAWSTEPEAAFK